MGIGVEEATKKLLEYDRLLCLKNALPEDGSNLAKSYTGLRRPIMSEGSEEHSEAELINLRKNILKGKFAEAEELAEQIKTQTSDQRTLSEILQEQAFQAIFEFDWCRGVVFLTQAIEGNSSPSSRLAQLQMRAVAYYEMGEFAKAMSDIEAAESLMDLFPYSPAKALLRGTEAKIQAKLAGVTQAREKIIDYWNGLIREKTFTSANLLTHLRLEISFRRDLGQNYQEYAYAAREVARLRGETYYQAFAELEYFYSLSSQYRDTHLADLKEILAENESLEVMSQAIENQESSFSTTVADIIRYNSTHSCESVLQPMKNIYFANEKWLVSLQPFQIDHFAKESQVLKAVESFAGREVEKPEVFRTLWGTQKYVPRLHDQLIWNLNKRMKKDFHLDVSIDDEKLLIKGVACLR